MRKQSMMAYILPGDPNHTVHYADPNAPHEALRHIMRHTLFPGADPPTPAEESTTFYKVVSITYPVPTSYPPMARMGLTTIEGGRVFDLPDDATPSEWVQIATSSACRALEVIYVPDVLIRCPAMFVFTDLEAAKEYAYDVGYAEVWECTSGDPLYPLREDLVIGRGLDRKKHEEWLAWTLGADVAPPRMLYPVCAGPNGLPFVRLVDSLTMRRKV